MSIGELNKKPTASEFLNKENALHVIVVVNVWRRLWYLSEMFSVTVLNGVVMVAEYCRL